MRPPGTTRTGCAVTVLAAAGMLLSTLAGISGASHSQQAEARVPDVTTDAAPDAKVLRRAKCAYLWQRMAPHSYSPEIVEHFISEHERMGIGPEWLASLTYGFANFGLRLNKRAPGLCYGPMDVKWGGYARRAGCRRPDDLRNWQLNITAHCLEARVGVGKGYRGQALCRYIMFPARPHDWGGGRFRRTWQRCLRLLAEGYAAGKIVGTEPRGGH